MQEISGEFHVVQPTLMNNNIRKSNLCRQDKSFPGLVLYMCVLCCMIATRD